jgi:hypothetical protein
MLTNMSLRHAQQALRQAGLTTGRIVKRPTGYPRVILRQDPTATTSVAAGTHVDLVVSKLFPVPLVAVPRLGEFGWSCTGPAGGERYTITFRSKAQATSYVTNRTSSGAHARRKIDPGERMTSPKTLGGEQRWRIVQATEPQTIVATVHISLPSRCSDYALPKTTLSVAGHSH